MTCNEVMEKLYGSGGEEALPLQLRVRIMAHLFFCGHCAAEARKLALAQRLMAEEFFPPAPSFEDRVMAALYEEAECDERVSMPDTQAVSFRGWVITGCIIVVSLATSFFGMDFMRIASTVGQSFLLPVGLTVGFIVTGYGAIFIGSHLKELSDRFLR